MTRGPADEIATLSSRIVYRNRWMTVREDRIRRGDGQDGLYGVVDKPDYALIVPVDGDVGFHLVEQYRYPIGRRVWEFPQGACEVDPGRSAIDVARAELAEETGLVAGEMVEAGRLYGAYGFCSQAFRVFVARDLHPGVAAPEPEEHGLVTRRFSRDEVVAMLTDGRIEDASSVAAFGLLQLKRLID